jgi:hypothetical protein
MTADAWCVVAFVILIPLLVGLALWEATHQEGN